MSLLKNLWSKIPKSKKDLEWFVRVNPTLDEVVIEAPQFRYPTPGSQPLPQFAETPNDRPYKNYYYQRDTRRAWPVPTVYESKDVPAITGEALKAIPASSAATTTSSSSSTTYKLPPIVNNRYKYKTGKTPVDQGVEYYPIAYRT